MAWKDTLLPASFRNINIEIESIGDDIDRSIVAHEYPYVDGANIEDMGRMPRHIGITAVFYGDDYEIKLQQFLSVLDEPGAGELIHPVFGSLQVQFVRLSVQHSYDRTDYARLTLDFIEAKLRTPLFDRVLPLQQIDAVNQSVDDVLAGAKTRFTLDIGKALNLPSLLRDKLSADMLNAIDNMRHLADQLIDARGWVASGVYYLNNPIAFVDDISSGLISRVQAIFSPMNLRLGYSGVSSSGGVTNGLNVAGSSSVGSFGITQSASVSSFSTADNLPVGYSRGSLTTVWKAPLAYLQQPLLTLSSASPATSANSLITTLTSDGVVTQPFLVAHITVQQAIAIASAAAEIYSLDLGVSVLTPDDVEAIAADTRSTIANAITLVRTTFPDIVQSRPITEPLKALALTITVAAEKLIRAKPPLINRIVDSAGNLQLLAHLWYNDYRRADELLRLNPAITNPNFIMRGTSLRAYAV